MSKTNQHLFHFPLSLDIDSNNVVKISLNNEFIIITPNHSDPDIYLKFKIMAFADMAFTELSEFLNNPPENKNVFDMEKYLR